MERIEATIFKTGYSGTQIVEVGSLSGWGYKACAAAQRAPTDAAKYIDSLLDCSLCLPQSPKFPMHFSPTGSRANLFRGFRPMEEYRRQLWVHCRTSCMTRSHWTCTLFALATMVKGNTRVANVQDNVDVSSLQLSSYFHLDEWNATIGQCKVFPCLPPYPIPLRGMHMHIAPRYTTTHFLEMQLGQVCVYVVEKRVCNPLVYRFAWR
jgi:hypothetical protein